MLSSREGSTQLIDHYLPNYDYTEAHHLDISANQSDTYEVARHLDFSQSRVTGWLFKLRGIRFDTLTIDEMISGNSFALLEENPPHEFVIGLAGAGTTPASIQSGEHFISLAPSQGIKIAWNFRTEVVAPGTTRLHTETRTACYGRATKAAFAAYWTIVRPFSGLIRKEMLKQARNQARDGSAGRSTP